MKLNLKLGNKTTGNLKLKIKVEEYGEYLEYPISA